MKTDKQLIIESLQDIIITKLCKQETVLSSHVNKQVLRWMYAFKKIQHIRGCYRFSKKETRDIFKHVKNRLVLAGN